MDSKRHSKITGQTNPQIFSRIGTAMVTALNELLENPSELTIEQLTSVRGIAQVVHFTRRGNLRRILAEGLIPRASLEARHSHPEFNDPVRYDGARDANCCSISHPNYKMFYRLRNWHPEEEWVVIVLQPSILWEKGCAFCIQNAACNDMRQIPVEQRKGLNAFGQLFNEIEGKPSREDLGIPADYPTHPQAEVLVFDTIEPGYIIGVACQSRNAAASLGEEFGGFQFRHAENFFSARKDYRHWQ